MRKDDNLMSMLSIWGIILVVLGHSGFTSPVIADELPRLHEWIYSFHMPLFFFISGYLYSLTNASFSNISSKKFILKKLRRLMAPYFVLGIIVFAIKFVFSGFASVTREFSLSSFLYMFVAPQSSNSTMGFLWYLITLFLIFCITMAFKSIGVNLKSNRTSTFVCVLSWLLYYLLPHVELLNISGVLWYIPFFILGIIFNNIIQTNNHKSYLVYERSGG